MKFAILLTVVSALAAGEAYVAKPAFAPSTVPATRANFGIGGISVGDRLLYRVRVTQYPIPNAIQSQDIIYRGNTTTRITGIWATEQGATQYASAWLVAGGLNWSNATLRVQSLPSRGYDYVSEFWGR